MGKGLQRTVLAVLFLVGLAIFSYPHVQGLLVKREMESTVQTFQEQKETQPTSYFRYIDQLQIGDTVTVTNLWEQLTYRVAEIKIIYPYEVDQILIQPGRELLTLLTCHPYASGGKQRYLVICERVYQEDNYG